MATHDVEMRVNLRKNTNEKSDQFGHYYPYLDRISTLDTRGLVKHIASHNTIYGREVIEGVVTLFSNCIMELLSTGVAVKLTSIGTFYPTLKSRPGGAATLDEARNYGADDLVTGVHVRFWPDGTDLDDITSKTFKERCTLKLHMIEEITVTTVGDKKVYRHTYKPVYEKDENDPNP